MLWILYNYYIEKRKYNYMVQFNPQKEEKEVISLRISTNMIKELDEKANLFEMSRNELIIQSIRFALDNINKETIKSKKAEE